MCVLAPQSCPTLWDPMDYSLPGSSVHGFSRQGYWSGLPFPSLGDLPYQRIEPMFLMSPALAGRFCTIRIMWKRDSRLLWKWVTTAGGILEGTSWWICVLRGDVCPLNFSASVPNLVAIRTQGHALCYCSKMPISNIQKQVHLKRNILSTLYKLAILFYWKEMFPLL